MSNSTYIESMVELISKINQLIHRSLLKFVDDYAITSALQNVEKRIYRIYEYALKNQDLVTDDVYKEFEKASNLFIDVLSSIENDTLSDENNKRTFLLNAITTVSHSFYKIQRTIEILLNRLDYDNKLLELTEQSEQKAEEISQLSDELREKVDDLENRLAEPLQKFELMRLDQIFADTAHKNRRFSFLWVSLIIITSFLLFCLVSKFINECWLNLSCFFDNDKQLLNLHSSFIQTLSKTKSPNQSIINANSATQNNIQVILYFELVKKALLRFFLISIVVFLLKFFIKNYNAVMHNVTVNEHKANILAAVLRSINILEDKEAKNKLLEIASKEIFIIPKTGYLSKEETKFDFKLMEKLSALFHKKSDE